MTTGQLLLYVLLFERKYACQICGIGIYLWYIAMWCACICWFIMPLLVYDVNEWNGMITVMPYNQFNEQYKIQYKWPFFELYTKHTNDSVASSLLYSIFFVSIWYLLVALVYRLISFYIEMMCHIEMRTTVSVIVYMWIVKENVKKLTATSF